MCVCVSVGACRAAGECSNERSRARTIARSLTRCPSACLSVCLSAARSGLSADRDARESCACARAREASGAILYRARCSQSVGLARTRARSLASRLEAQDSKSKQAKQERRESSVARRERTSARGATGDVGASCCDRSLGSREIPRSLAPSCVVCINPRTLWLKTTRSRRAAATATIDGKMAMTMARPELTD